MKRQWQPEELIEHFIVLGGVSNEAVMKCQIEFKTLQRNGFRF